MAIDKLNFSGINSSGSESLVTPMGSLSERLMKYGSILNQNALDEAKQKRLDEQDAYQKQRDARSDANYEADKKERLDDKNRLLQKDYNTANAMSAIENKDAYIAGRMSSEQKAIQDTLNNATPEERLQMQQELKGYDQKASGQQWANTALSQSNVDSKDITNLKRDITKENKREEEFNKKLKADQSNADRLYNLNKMQYDQTALEKKDKEKATSAGVSAFMNNNVENATLVSKDSKDGEMIIKDENLNSHKEAFNEFGKTKDIQALTSKLKTAQQNGSTLYSDEQLSDPVFVKKLYDESQAGQKSQASEFIEKNMKSLSPWSEYALEDRTKVKEIESKINNLKNKGSIVDKFFTKGSENENIKNEIISLESQLNSFKDKNKKQSPEVTYQSLEDFSAKIKADNKAKKDELVTLQNQLDSAYKTKDIELKNKFGTIKKENIYVPKEEKQYAQDIVTSEFEKAKKEGRTLSANEQAAIVITAKDIAKNHQANVDKEEKAALDIKLKQIEKASDVDKTLIGEIEKENSSLRQAINDASMQDDDKDYSYVVGDKKTNDKTAYIADLRAQLYQNKNRIDKILKIKN